MRLFLSVLLVTLALCCYEANATACPALVADTALFLTGRKYVYKKSLKKYDAHSEYIQSGLKVKSCTDSMELSKRLLLTDAMRRMVASCGN